MFVSKFGGLVNPYFPTLSSITEDQTVGEPRESSLYNDAILHLCDCDRDSYVEYEYTGHGGQLASIDPDDCYYSVNHGKISTSYELRFSNIETGDVVTVYFVGKKKKRNNTEPKLSVSKIGGSVEDYLLTDARPRRRLFRFPLESGTIISVSATPSKILLNNSKVDSLNGVSLKMDDVIEFVPDMLYFEANLVIRCPIIKEN